MINLKKSADYIRYLSLASIQRANSGHPGLPLGCAELGILLYRYAMRYNPGDSRWINRDRFILSAGHGSMLIYSLLHTIGYNISLEDLGKFRQMGSKTAGHPEYDLHDGIETTTGPLGQGFANAVGIAIEGKMEAQRFNKKNNTLFDYTVYTLMGDGCNMEGISYEAGSMAGHLGLDNLIAIYDSNHISIDGHTDITFTEDVGRRYEALGWHVEYAEIADIQDTANKLEALRALKGKPKLLIVKTIIGQGVNKKKDTSGIHGSPAGYEEIAYFVQHSTIRDLFEAQFGKEAVADTSQLASLLEKQIKSEEPLLPLPAVTQFMREAVDLNKQHYADWEKTFRTYQQDFQAEYNQLSAYRDFAVSAELEAALLNYNEAKPTATRNISGKVLNIAAAHIPQIVGGCADLVGSTKAEVSGSKYIDRNDFSGRNIAFGVREHAMGAVGNGLALNRMFIPFTSTFFTFFDYMKPAIRLAALMKLNHMFIFSHDSIYVGEDGPTHQPIEHLNALRMIPDMIVFRPGSDLETAFAMLYFLKKMNGPAALITTRQNLVPAVFQLPEGRKDNRSDLYNQFSRGGYVFYETNKSTPPDIILSGSGSELGLALETATLIEERDNKNVRVVSLPSLELLSTQDREYRDGLFIPGVPQVLIEAASHRAVDMFYNRDVTVIDIQSFGLSAPGETVGDHFGFTAEKVYQRIKN